jgi:hypothetical protein
LYDKEVLKEITIIIGTSPELLLHRLLRNAFDSIGIGCILIEVIIYA